jgi:hypothetical protein
MEPDPEALDRRDDVGEQDRGVDAVAADRLEGDLGGQVGVWTTSSKECCSRIARYSARARPACRMNQTGT